MKKISKIINKSLIMIKPYITMKKDKKIKEILEKINVHKYETIVIFENNFGWNGIMKQRPQQIASNFDDNILFIYHSNRDKYDNKYQYKEIKDNLILINMDIYRNKILKYLRKFSDKFLMIYSTNYISEKTINIYKNHKFKLIYEYVDDIDEKLCGKKTTQKLFENFNNIVMNNRNYIICTANKLYNNVLNSNKNARVKLITNGCDYEHFKKKEYKIPNEIAKIKNSNKPIIGYYGALASWFDYDLIKKMSDTNKYEIVLIGLKYDDSLEESDILNLENVYYLGKKDYDELPIYSSYFDVCIIPFIINEITLSTSPVKLFEYMASEKPIVTTNLPECHKYKSILISKDHQEFIENLDKAIGLAKDKNYIELLRKDALNNTWSSKCNEIINFISEV
ncbi:MAG: glycosyltransferase [Ignavibacteriales bacterium]